MVNGGHSAHPRQAMPSSFTQSTAVLFLTDLHLDRATRDQTVDLLRRIDITRSDSVIVTGDISNAHSLHQHLGMLAAACAPRPLYFLAGNHDYYGGSFRGVELQLHELCQSTHNLHHLDGSSIFRLTDGIGLIGHSGWPDARAGDGMKTRIESPDQWNIKELRALDQSQMLDWMQSMGRESAKSIRSLYPLALTRYRHVIVATHVPPFDNAVIYNGRPADRERLPHFCNLSLGKMLIRILRSFPHRRVSVLAGHTHASCHRRITSNLSVRVGAARNGGCIPMELVRFTT